MSIQLDLFEIAEQDERAALSKLNPDPESLRMGDIVHIHWNNGVEFDGICTGLRGFWDNRVEFRTMHWVLRTNIWHKGDSEPSEGFRDYSHFDPHRDEWVYIGRDDSYRVPDRETIAERLIDRLKVVPFDSRLNVYHAFEAEYPRLSYDYNAGMNLMSNAWKRAIVAVTTIDDVLSSKKEWTCKAKFPKEAVSHIRDVIFNADREQWVHMLKQIHWSESAYTGSDGRENWRVNSLCNRNTNIYTPLLDALIPQARNATELLKLAEIRGEDNQVQFTQEKPQKFWIEDDAI